MKLAFQQLSLTTRLSIVLTWVCCAVFICIGLLSYQDMENMLAQQRDQNLAARIQRIELFLQDTQSFQVLVNNPLLYENMLGKEDNFLILKNPNQTLIDINPSKITIPPLPTATTINFTDNQGHAATTRLAYKTVLFDHQSYQLIAGKQLAEGQRILNQYLSKLVLYSLLGIALASLLGRWAGVYLLRSLNELIAQTHHIQGNALDQRINIQNPSIEVEKLRTAINSMLAKIQLNYAKLSQFSEDIAHELRTPLNNLIGQTQIMLMQPRSQQALEQLLYSHLEEYERLSKMINDMLFIARSEHRDYIFDKSVIDLSNLIIELVDYFEWLAHDKHMSFNLNLSPDIAITANTDLLKRTLSNLMINAIDYGLDHQAIVITTTADAQTVTIDILTQAVYIAESHLPYLFERFYQVESSRQGKAKTGGLGLAIVKSIMALHQGEALAFNTEAGVVFRLILPR